ncbi:MAG: hypothetical protein J6I71_01845 [Campylobacter sp.]|uniref:hypothetical protein n=1 Tax=Campylobacter sp. TaxID=205 RepID=UPI001B4EB32F|nr:hypothetical protein [Campylobacter sp.]MBP3675195.1 hypothetical protein [Campylobacter sp.]
MNTKIALILYRFKLDEFKPLWNKKAAIVCKHTQRMRIMWERIYENEATLPLFDNDYEPKSIAELFTPELPQSIEAQQPKEQTKNRHNKNTPTMQELKEIFWAEELRDNKKSKNKGAIYE